MSMIESEHEPAQMTKGSHIITKVGKVSSKNDSRVSAKNLKEKVLTNSKNGNIFSAVQKKKISQHKSSSNLQSPKISATINSKSSAQLPSHLKLPNSSSGMFKHKKNSNKSPGI